MADIKISQLTNVASVSETDLFEISQDDGGGNFTSKSVRFKELKESLEYSRIIRVDLNGTGDSTTIKGAIDIAETMTRTNTEPVLIEVGPGHYIEDNPLIVPTYTNIVATGSQFDVGVTPLDPNDVVFHCPSYVGIGVFRGSLIRGMYIRNASGPNGVGVLAEQPFTVIQDCITSVCTTGFKSNGIYSSGTVCLSCAVLEFGFTPAVTCANGYQAANGGVLVIEASLTNALVSGTINNGISIEGTGSKGYIQSANISDCINALYVNDEGYVLVTGMNIYTGVNGLRIGPDGGATRIIGTGVNINDQTGNDLYIENVDGHIDFIGSMSSYKRSIVSGATVHAYAVDESTGTMKTFGPLESEGRMDVGFPSAIEIGADTGVDIGTGRSHWKSIYGDEIVEYWGMDDSAVSGSKFVRYNDNAGVSLSDVGDCFIVGSYTRMSSLKLDVIIPFVLTGGVSLIAEYWNGLTWVEVDMTAYEESTFTNRKNMPFYNAETQYVEFSDVAYHASIADYDIVDNIPAWDNSLQMYAYRFRISGGSFPSGMTFSNGLVKSSNFSVQSAGNISLWGINRTQGSVSYSADSLIYDPITPPVLESVELSPNLFINANNFGYGVVSKGCIFTNIPQWVDLSTPALLKFGGMVTSSIAGDINIDFTVLKLGVGQPVGSITTDGYSSITSIPAGQANKTVRLEQNISIQEYTPGQAIIICMSRNSSGNPNDTYQGDFKQIGFIIDFTRKTL